jgi:hypothetical protein
MIKLVIINLKSEFSRLAFPPDFFEPEVAKNKITNGSETLPFPPISNPTLFPFPPISNLPKK